MGVIKLGVSCLNVFLYCFPLIVNILLTIWNVWAPYSSKFFL